ncbi:hypothetical protein SynRS9902_01167 [Synechococcus sp. RS9902]|nr:hypothetical protein SynRS9902_01167 [Synechococcus sp. RS9902]
MLPRGDERWKADTRQLKRKLSSIQSLLRLAEVIYEVVD